jgi:hypothetical protein
MAPIPCRATVTLQSPLLGLLTPGDVVDVDPNDAPLYFALGYLVPTEPLPMPDDERPARHRKTTAKGAA